MGNNVTAVTQFEFIKEFWQYRELFYFFIWRDIKVRYKQTLLGAMWAVIQPFMTMVIFTIFFGKFAKIPSEGVPYPIFSYSGVVPWTFFAGAIGLCGNSLVGNSNLLTKVYFPRVAIPVSAVLSGLIDFFIASIILFGIMIFYNVPLGWKLLLWPVLVIPLIVLALGVGLIFASLNVKYRDIKYALPFIVQIWLFATPIIYPISIVPEQYRTLVGLNPLTGLMGAFRSVVIIDKQIDLRSLLSSLTISLFILLFGLFYFRTTEKEFADII